MWDVQRDKLKSLSVDELKRICISLEIDISDVSSKKRKKPFVRLLIDLVGCCQSFDLTTPRSANISIWRYVNLLFLLYVHFSDFLNWFRLENFRSFPRIKSFFWWQRWLKQVLGDTVGILCGSWWIIPVLEFGRILAFSGFLKLKKKTVEFWWL